VSCSVLIILPASPLPLIIAVHPCAHKQSHVGNPLFKQVLCCISVFWVRKSRLFSIH